MLSEEHAALSLFRDATNHDPLPCPAGVRPQAIDRLCIGGLLRRVTAATPSFAPLPRYAITDMGRKKLEELDRLENQLKQKAQSKADQDAAENARRMADDIRHKASERRSWWQFWLGLVIGWVLGGFTAKEAWNFLIGLF